MSFRIDYFRDGIKVATHLSYKPIDGARLDARRGLKMHRVDQAHLRDLETGRLVERLERDPRDPDR